MDDISSIDPSPAPIGAPRRHRARRTFVAVAALAVLAVAPACSSDDSSSGKPMPEASLVTLDDEQAVELANLADGKPTVVNFWASWCAPCRKEMPAFQQVADDLGDQVAIVGITDEDELAAAREAAAKAEVSYPLVVDTDQTLLTDLGISGLPGTVFLDEDGNVVGTHLGAMDEAELTQEIEDRYGITA